MKIKRFVRHLTNLSNLSSGDTVATRWRHGGGTDNFNFLPKTTRCRFGAGAVIARLSVRKQFPHKRQTSQRRQRRRTRKARTYPQSFFSKGLLNKKVAAHMP